MSNYQLVTVIADFFNVSTDFLLNRTSDPTPPKRSEEDQLGDSILSHFRLNTADMEVEDMEVEDIEELEEELNEYMDFLVQRAKAKKNKK
ncbi:TPA: Cro/Cl family transcriptional regulator [Enterococcus faecium]|uniref:Cro/Cl family transcriptional regulator n=1 Tax=Enterococcus TaxID=1350 RepID=UPI0021A3FA35|nr:MULTISPECIES: Cro/Cl family transcriptional regulator [Enterococcus]MDU0319118.1 Cro/Cl family transcriptional regulator [Enterococcus sp. 2STP]MDU0334229.1 Cro/Cl family transcriptional regulator [Enterococcus sp. 2CBP]MDU0351937.1 Cro/Cl family transcriptional regulator [Enterococcus sp. 3MOLP]